VVPRSCQSCVCVPPCPQVVDADGWLHTGDMGYFDSQGQLWLRGRAKDMVKSGGENVYAAEVS
jgi:acyl-activating enzyme 14